jgi:betaine-aldehyde dehydrogenase
VGDSAACFRYYAGLITKPQGQTFEVPDPNITSMVVREPIGVCGQIVPWNYPLMMAAWKLAPGLALEIAAFSNRPKPLRSPPSSFSS